MEQSKDYVTEKIFGLSLKQGQKQDKKLEFKFFLVYLLVSLALASWLHFFKISALNLNVGLAFDKVESINGKVALDLSE